MAGLTADHCRNRNMIARAQPSPNAATATAETIESHSIQAQNDDYADIPFDDTATAEIGPTEGDSLAGEGEQRPAVEPAIPGQGAPIDEVASGAREAESSEGVATEPKAPSEPATEQTDQGEQTLIDGVAPITTRDRIEAQQDKPLTGGDAALPAGGLFDEDARNQGDLLDAAREGDAPDADETTRAPSDTEPRFSRATQPRSITPPSTKQLNAVIKRVTSRWKADVTVTLVDGFADLPAPIQQAARDQGSDGSDIRGVFHGGSIYLVRGNIALIHPRRQNQ